MESVAATVGSRIIDSSGFGQGGNLNLMRISCLIACAAIAPLLIAATEPVRLQPSSQWIVDYADNSCRLVRTFGEGQAKTVLLFESEGPDRMDMVATGKPLRSNAEEVGVRFLPAGKTFDGRVAKTTNSDDPAVLWSAVSWLPDQLAEALEKEKTKRNDPGVRPPPINLAERAIQRSQRQQFAEKATELEIQTRRNHPVILETGPMGGPIRAFDKCSRDSLKDWGIDPDLEDRIVRPVWAPGGISKWFRTDDYPKEMLMQRKESDVKIRLLVDASGKVSKCTSLSHYDAPQFNQITCNTIMKRAKIEPAELADGTKVPSYATLRIRWELAR